MSLWSKAKGSSGQDASSWSRTRRWRAGLYQARPPELSPFAPGVSLTYLAPLLPPCRSLVPLEDVPWFPLLLCCLCRRAVASAWRQVRPEINANEGFVLEVWHGLSLHVRLCHVAETACGQRVGPESQKLSCMQKTCCVGSCVCCCCLFPLCLLHAAAAYVNSCSFSFNCSLSCASRSHPVFFFVLLNRPSLYSLKSVIRASHLQRENMFGCTLSHLDVRFSVHDLTIVGLLISGHMRTARLCLPLQCGVPICAAVVFFHCRGPSRICLSSHVLLCVFISTILFLLLSSKLQCLPQFSLPMMSVVLALFPLDTSHLAIQFLPAPLIEGHVRTAKHFVQCSVCSLCLFHADLYRKC